MLYEYADNQIQKKKFFQRETTFKRFINIDEDKLEEIKKQVDLFSNNFDIKKLSGLALYNRVLEYLQYASLNSKFRTFDEQIIFFILVLDPKLVVLKTYLSTEIISLKQIEKAPDNEKDELAAKRSMQLHKFIAHTREILGFYDSKLLKYESLYYETFIKLDQLVSNIVIDYTTSFLIKASIVTSFSGIDGEKFTEIKRISLEYQGLVEDPTNIHTLAYNILSKRVLFSELSLKELYVLLIYTIDPNLLMLQIYEEESNINNIKRRIIEQFGYYNEELLRLEKLYHQRFFPNKKISIWSDERKLKWMQN